MNFYKSQDEARKKTKLLVFYYILAIVATVLFMYALLSLVYVHVVGGEGAQFDVNGQPLDFWQKYLDFYRFMVVSGVTIAVILMGSAYKSMQVSAGGGVVASSLGGRLVDPSTNDAEERQLLNIVEEMAIASGVPVPQVWVIDADRGINAFAAGTEPGNAVIGVTRGTIQRLNRAELQGVVAHEFSHILNGDMKMNIRLMCMLHGLLLLSIIGYSLMRISFFTGSSRNRSKEGAGVGVALVVSGICIIVVGTVGAFFASLIQAAISRQREYLADASAVEFTMDPNGIAGALKKIGGCAYRGNVSAPAASELEHMFFAPSGMFNYGMASHPPLEERIGLIEPDWDGGFEESSIRDVESSVKLQKAQQRPSNPLDNFGMGAVVAGAMLDGLGESSQTNIGRGQKVLNGLDASWIHACHDKYQAQLLIYGLLLAEDGKLKQSEVSHLKNAIGQQMTDLALGWQSALMEIHSSKKIALIDIAIPTLRQLSSLEYDRFIELTQWLIRSDSNVDLFEFMLQKMLQRHLDAHFKGQRRITMKHRSLGTLNHPTNIVLSTLAGVGAKSEQALREAYAAATELLQEYGCPKSHILPPDQCGIGRIDEALAEIECATPMVKKQFLLVCGKVVMLDGEVTSREAELLRATADAIGCPIPPFVNMV